MTKEELDKKVNSFSGHNGMGKTYNYYELTDTSKINYDERVLGARLPLKVFFKITSANKSFIYLLLVIAAIELFAIGLVLKNNAPKIYLVYFSVLGLAIALRWYSFIERRDKAERLQIIMTEEHIAFNKDVFKWTDIETTHFKRDFNKVKEQLFLWVIIELKNGDLYYYQLKKIKENKKLSGGLTFQELLFLYHHYAAPDKNREMRSFGV